MVAEPEGLGGAKECLAAVGLSPLLVVLELLGFAHVEGGDVELSPSCRTFAKVDILRRKEISTEHLQGHPPRCPYPQLDQWLDHRARGALPRGLKDRPAEEQARRVLDTVTKWGRYAELFAYDIAGVLYLE